MIEINMNSIIAQMRSMAARAEGGREALDVASPTQTFAGIMKAALDRLNTTQQNASALTEAFEKGDKSVDPVQAMIGLQKASISFNAATQVRNKFVTAYQEIMNMPV